MVGGSINQYVKRFFWVLGLVLIIPVGLFVVAFFDQRLSNKITDWGTFGDFIGGIYNPIIGLANLLVLIFISLIVAKLEGRRERAGLIFKLYMEFTEKTDLALYERDINKLGEVKEYLSSFKSRYSFLLKDYAEKGGYYKAVIHINGSNMLLDQYINMIDNFNRGVIVEYEVDDPFPEIKGVPRSEDQKVFDKLQAELNKLKDVLQDAVIIGI